ncbi:MAG: response regulator [Candidatus Omnitrophica bacterium]|nr:response regulator [Candidatus Omnitrophota bacterium]
MSKRVLIIDDNEGDRYMMKEIIQENYANIQVFEASDGATGIEVVRKESPDIAIVDTMLPGTDGFETCKRIKENNNAIKVVLITGAMEGVDDVKIKFSKADMATVKGVDWSAFKQTFHEIQSENRT